MAEFELLHAEPRHKVTGFVDDLLGHRFATIQAMRESLKAVVIGICDQFERLKLRVPQLEFTRVIFAQTTWTKDAYLDIEIGYGDLPESVERYHIDELVAEIVDRNLRVAGLRDEIAGYVTGMVDQFTVLKDRHPLLSLRDVTFTDFKWVDEHLLFAIRSNKVYWGCHEAPHM